jgi:hypothetical protein
MKSTNHRMSQYFLAIDNDHDPLAQPQQDQHGSSVQPEPDVRVSGSGSILVVFPLSTDAAQWVEENVKVESWQWLGLGFAVEHRYLPNLIRAMQTYGLIVEGGFGERNTR